MVNKKEGGLTVLNLVVIVIMIGLVAFVVWRGFEAASQQRNSQTNGANHTNPNTGYFVITGWGARLKLADGLTGLKTLDRPSSISGGEEKMFMTDEMQKLNAACSGAAEGSRPLGALVRTKTAINQPGDKQLVKQIGDYFYYYYPPASSCSPDAANEALQTKTLTQIKASISSLEAAK